MAALALLGAACGDDDPAPAATTPVDELTVTEYDGEDLVATRTLDCAPADATCTRVVALLPALRPDPREACTLIYGGPQRYTVEGTVAGEPVAIEVTRANGCDITRFDRLREALGDPPLAP